MEQLKKYWWIILIVILLVIWYYYTADTEEKKETEVKKKFIGGGSSDCEPLTQAQWNEQRGFILRWLDWDASPQKRDEISCIYWEKSGDVWTDIAYRFADDEILRKGFCKPK